MTFNFIINCENKDLALFESAGFSEVMGKMARWDYEWCFQTYKLLQQRQTIPVTLSNRFLDNAINIVHSASLLPLKGNASHFIVCIQADFPHRKWAHFHIVQNKSQISQDSAFVPFWIQPGIRKRNPNRNQVRTVAYIGQTFNGNLAETPIMWQSLLQPFGLEFKVLQESEWNNLEEVDILIGIRSFDKRPYNSKPASKMLNAWHAEVPFIGGNDSAFLQFGHPGEDFLRVGTKQEALQAILKLRNDPVLFQKLVENGKKNAQLFNNDTIAAKWEETLLGAVISRFELWRSRPLFEKIAFMQKLNFSMLNHQSKQLLKILYRTGQ